MKKLNIIAAVFLIGILFASCRKVVGEGPLVTENRPVGNFTSIVLAITGDLYVNFKQSPTYKLEISAQQNVLNVIDAHILNNELVIKTRDGVKLKSHEPIVMNINCPKLDGLTSGGSGKIYLDSMQTDNINLTLSGSGNLNLSKLLVTSLNVNISGSGNINIAEGSAGNERLKISGSGGIDIRNVLANDVTTTTSGSGEMHVNAAKTLEVNISGSGSVYYSGTPVVNTHISGSGSVIHE